MYDIFDSDEYFFNNEVFSIIKMRDKNKLFELINRKHSYELMDSIPVTTKKNDLIIWNAVFTREIINKGPSKQYLHPLYNKYYKAIQTCNDLPSLQELENKMVTSYFDILVNFVEVTDNFIINKIITYLYTHLENHLTIKELSDDLHISEGYISTCFKKNMNMSVMNYFKKIKIDRSKTLLIDSDKSILEISTSLGFCDQCHFTKVFKKIVGITPTEFRNRSRK